MRGVYFIVYCFTLSIANAQSFHFYDRNGVPCGSLNAFYYETQIEHLRGWVELTAYYMGTNQVKIIDERVDEEDLRLRTYFFPNGAVKVKGYFFNSIPNGPIVSFYSNDKQQSELIYERRDYPEIHYVVKVINYWDSLGNKLVDNGRGYCNCNLSPFYEIELIERGLVTDSLKHGNWEGWRGKILEFNEIYDKGKLLQSAYHHNDSIFDYTYIESMAMPNGGLRAFYQQITKSISNTKTTRRDNVKGRVIIEFMVEKNGELSEFKILESIDEELDALLIDALKSSTRWNPGFKRGTPVRQKMVLPLKF